MNSSLHNIDFEMLPTSTHAIKTNVAIEIDSETNAIYTLLPPAPPSPSPSHSIENTETETMQTVLTLEIPSDVNNEEINSGNFHYIKDHNSRIIMENGYKAVNITKLWCFLKKPIESFSFSDSPEVRIIYNKMEELGYYGHSGFSFGWTMRNLQDIAIHGERSFKRNWKNKET
jgi:hypothetical protein